mmetsp:Transcript_18404/g.59866  ORF Transcript_18404/g.59866 Transcript_18404/m.59866 type:complete len:591 (+) Transcript_18404:7082-8854(+)
MGGGRGLPARRRQLRPLFGRLRLLDEPRRRLRAVPRAHDVEAVFPPFGRTERATDDLAGAERRAHDVRAEPLPDAGAQRGAHGVADSDRDSDGAPDARRRVPGGGRLRVRGAHAPLLLHWRRRAGRRRRRLDVRRRAGRFLRQGELPGRQLGRRPAPRREFQDGRGAPRVPRTLRRVRRRDGMRGHLGSGQQRLLRPHVPRDRQGQRPGAPQLLARDRQVQGRHRRRRGRGVGGQSDAGAEPARARRHRARRKGRLDLQADGREFVPAGHGHLGAAVLRPREGHLRALRLADKAHWHLPPGGRLRRLHSRRDELRSSKGVGGPRRRERRLQERRRRRRALVPAEHALLRAQRELRRRLLAHRGLPRRLGGRRRLLDRRPVLRHLLGQLLMLEQSSRRPAHGRADRDARADDAGAVCRADDLACTDDRRAVARSRLRRGGRVRLRGRHRPLPGRQRQVVRPVPREQRGAHVRRRRRRRLPRRHVPLGASRLRARGGRLRRFRTAVHSHRGYLPRRGRLRRMPRPQLELLRPGPLRRRSAGKSRIYEHSPRQRQVVPAPGVQRARMESAGRKLPRALLAEHLRLRRGGWPSL